jgi:hypothetical protein
MGIELDFGQALARMADGQVTIITEAEDRAMEPKSRWVRASPEYALTKLGSSLIDRRKKMLGAFCILRAEMGQVPETVGADDLATRWCHIGHEQRTHNGMDRLLPRLS